MLCTGASFSHHLHDAVDEVSAIQTHRQGVCWLYQLRGLKRFYTDFERTLLISQTPLILADGGFSGQGCFLDQQDWMAAIRSVSGWNTNNFHLSEYKLTRYEYMILIGRLTRDCNYLVLNQDSATTDTEELRREVLAELATMRDTIQAWLTRWKAVINPAKGAPQEFLGEGDSLAVRKNNAVAAKIFTIAYLRYHIAIGGEGAIEMERQVLRVAKDMYEDTCVIDSASSVFDVAFGTVVSESVFETSLEWQQHLQKTRKRKSGKAIAPEIWNRWMSRLGVVPE